VESYHGEKDIYHPTLGDDKGIVAGIATVVTSGGCLTQSINQSINQYMSYPYVAKVVEVCDRRPHLFRVPL